jgi:hypothetical protein
MFKKKRTASTSTVAVETQQPETSASDWRERLEKLPETSAKLLIKVKPASEKYKSSNDGLSLSLRDIDRRISDANRERATMLAAGQNPDDRLLDLGNQRRKRIEDHAAAEREATRTFNEAHARFAQEAGSIGGEIWREWLAVQKRILDFIENEGDLDQRLGFPAEKLSALTKQFQEDIGRFARYANVPRAQAKKIKTPRLVARSGFWQEWRPLIDKLRVWFR